MVLNGTIGARLHVAFPVLNRSSFGFWFSYFTVFSRIILSMFWFGIQVSHLHTITSPSRSFIKSLVIQWVTMRISGETLDRCYPTPFTT